MSSNVAYSAVPEVHDLFDAATEKFEKLKVRLCEPDTLDLGHDEVERIIRDDGREVLREMLQAHLDLRSFSEVVEPVVGADEEERTHHREGTERELRARSDITWSDQGVEAPGWRGARRAHIGNIRPPGNESSRDGSAA